MPEESPSHEARAWFDSKTIESVSKIMLALIAVLGFVWGIYKYMDSRERQLDRHEDALERQAETRRIEATRPYLERQLRLYTEATQVAARIATKGSAPGQRDLKDSPSASRYHASTLDNAVTRFWELYWGELALVEDNEVERAMVAYGQALRDKAPTETLQEKSLALAHACRDSLARSWGVEEWKSPAYGQE